MGWDDPVEPSSLGELISLGIPEPDDGTEA